MNEFNEKTAETSSSIKCHDCGANLNFEPGTVFLACEYCGAKNEIQSVKAIVEEIDYEKFLSETSSENAKQEVSTVKCDNCGASTSLRPNVTADNCPYCGSPLVIKNGTTSTIIKPKYVLPFHINRKDASEKFTEWVNSLWFAPNDLKNYAQNSAEKLKGVYLPYWTYDSNTNSDYIGARGTYYYVTVSYTATVNGKPVVRTRQERRTRWTSVSGAVSNNFNDILVCASNSLPRPIVKELEPWDLPALLAYDDKFLSGFVAESYQVNIKEGFGEAKGIMDGVIRTTVIRDIGGDDQRVYNINSHYKNITFKHILLPLWISAYLYRQKPFRFMINARTGEVKGERPYSAAKITLFVISLIGVIGGLIYLFGRH
jgi:DNA-directed RNA polymerase subunit RPC12/RpoP